MIISESGLVKAMKADYKAKGYRVHSTGTGYIMHGTGWYVSMEDMSIPRKVLSTMVEHGGIVPKSGETVCLSKGHEAQVILPEAAADEIGEWTAGAMGEGVECLPILVGLNRVFQAGREEGACYEVSDFLADILTLECRSRVVCGKLLGYARILVTDQSERVILQADRPATRYDLQTWKKRFYEAAEKTNLHPERGQDE